MLTGITEIDSVCKALEKKYSKKFFTETHGNIEFISTGSARLDFALGGGIPRGRIIEIFGWESTGKTSLCLSILKQAQDDRRKKEVTNKRDLIIDMEHSLTESFVTSFGIDMSQLLWVRPDTAEEALQIAIDLGKTGKIDIVIFDSVDAAQNEKQLNRVVGEVDVGGISKDMNFALRQLSKICVNSDTTYLFVNQIKQNPGQMFGN